MPKYNDLPPHLQLVEMEVERWFVKGEFNPASSDHIIGYMNATGHVSQPGKKSKTGKPSTDEQALERLGRKDAFYRHVLAWRKLQKLDSTYVSANLARLDENDRIHPKFPHVPSTWRLSSYDPNFQNIPDDDDPDSIERQFRSCVIADKGCVLVSADFSGIEAVLTGWYAGDEDYMRIATLIHSYLLAELIHEPADLSWPDAKLLTYLQQIKDKYHGDLRYKALKRGVHATNYGATAFLLHKTYPDLFPSLRSAESTQEFYLDKCPKLKAWHGALRRRAAKDNFLGGLDHPYRFKHWFWDVTRWDTKRNRWMPGADWNRVVSFYPQSTAAGVLFDTMLDLTDEASPYFIGDMFFGQTPLRAPIHDELVAEVEERHLDEYVSRLRRAMMQPRFQDFLPPDAGKAMPLAFNVSVNVGPNWGHMEPYAHT